MMEADENIKSLEKLGQITKHIQGLSNFDLKICQENELIRSLLSEVSYCILIYNNHMYTVVDRTEARFGIIRFGSEVSGKTEPNIYRIKSKMKDS